MSTLAPAGKEPTVQVQVCCFLLVSEGDNQDSKQEQRCCCFSEISTDGFFDHMASRLLAP